jgi:hypothetical protein
MTKPKNNRYPSDPSAYPFVAEKRCPYCFKRHQAVIYCVQDKQKKVVCPECLAFDKRRGPRPLMYKRPARDQPINNEILERAKKKEEMLKEHTESCSDYYLALRKAKLGR